MPNELLWPLLEAWTYSGASSASRRDHCASAREGASRSPCLIEPARLVEDRPDAAGTSCSGGLGPQCEAGRFSPASTRSASRFCFGGRGQVAKALNAQGGL